MPRRELDLRTGTRRRHDLTDAVREFVAEVGGEGLVNVFLPHATAGLAILETGSGSDRDLDDVVDDLLPRDDRWRHAHGSPGHGADHVLPAFLAPTLSIPFADGRPLLGTWQRVVLVDPNVDNPDRRVILSAVRGV